MAYFHARRTIASSLLRAFSSSYSLSSFSSSCSYSSSSSSIASRSRVAFSILTKQTSLVPRSLKFPIRFQTSAPDDSPAEESSKAADESSESEMDAESFKTTAESLKTAAESSETAAESSETAAESSKTAAESSKTDGDASKDSGEGSEEEKKKIILEGCDLEHWLVIMEFPKDQKKPSEEEMVNTYVKTLAEVVGSEEEAKKKMYSVSVMPYTGFGAAVSQELSTKLKGLPGVLWVLPDSYMDIVNKDYGGDQFVDGKLIPRPKYRNIGKRSGESNPESEQKNDRRGGAFQKENTRPTRKQNRSYGQRG
ncbi:multiple organellar RNA editing factor 3, mitochondrial [Senna tora]|uniref:Multiple organellar RNA editing factor 3, mitochondrial n=1 Tax=Senna tora TaxID=362788 RepID=A0A834T0F3_9FABA|nr:multiple organellar RNA editing factor 3, mitochondrial [Senna tora]